MAKRNVIIIGAAGRDFHNFNTYFRDNEAYNVVAFTAAQIPDIAGRKYPAALAGKLYPAGIPIFVESDLPKLIAEYKVDECVFAYSDVPYSHARERLGMAKDEPASGSDVAAELPEDFLLDLPLEIDDYISAKYDVEALLDRISIVHEINPRE